MTRVKGEERVDSRAPGVRRARIEDLDAEGPERRQGLHFGFGLLAAEGEGEAFFGEGLGNAEANTPTATCDCCDFLCHSFLVEKDLGIRT